jgi:hypothetical protein
VGGGGGVELYKNRKQTAGNGNIAQNNKQYKNKNTWNIKQKYNTKTHIKYLKT